MKYPNLTAAIAAGESVILKSGFAANGAPLFTASLVDTDGDETPHGDVLASRTGDTLEEALSGLEAAAN